MPEMWGNEKFATRCPGLVTIGFRVSIETMKKFEIDFLFAFSYLWGLLLTSLLIVKASGRDCILALALYNAIWVGYIAAVGLLKFYRELQAIFEENERKILETQEKTRNISRLT